MKAKKEFPTKAGYYWFRGQVKKPGQKRGSYRLTMLYVYNGGAHGEGIKCSAECFEGEWWGPVTPPWNES